MNNYNALRRIAAIIDETLSVTPPVISKSSYPKVFEEIRLIALESIKEADAPTNTVPAPEIQHILSRDQRELLTTACAYLRLMQEHYPAMRGYIEDTRYRIRKMMNGKV